MASVSFGEREGQVVDIDISFAQPVEPNPRVPNLVTRPNVVEALDPKQQVTMQTLDPRQIKLPYVMLIHG